MESPRSSATTQVDPTAVDYAAMVKPDPHKPGRAFYRLVDSERPIWAIIMHLINQGDSDDPTQASDALIAQTADDYAISEAEVRAAIAYYAANGRYIDAWLLINSDTGRDT
jgi:hypothetical protein